MEMVVSAPALPADVEMALIRDITVAAEAQAKEGNTFYLITTRSGRACACPLFVHLPPPIVSI
jgi:hypothetical protein